MIKKWVLISLTLCAACHALWAQTILSIQTAADDVIVIVLASGPHDGNSYQNPVDMEASKWQVDGGAVKKVNRWSNPWDEYEKDRQGFAGYPVFMRHHIYLTLNEKLVNGKAYSITTPHGSQSFSFDEEKTFCESIKTNQVGYNPQSKSRYANLGIFLGEGGSRKLEVNPAYSVIDTATGKSVASGAAAYWGDETALTGMTSGEHVYRIDLSNAPAGGPYRISVKGFGASHPFEISEAASRRISAVHARGMYHQRCGIALERPFTEFTRGICHATVAHTKTAPWTADGWITVSKNDSMHAIKGGYHDAGDFDRRPMHTVIPILMLGYFEAFKDRFADNQYNIPESGNGIPDFLDEALWGMLVWENLQLVDGGVMAGTERERHPGYGEVSAATEKAAYGTWEVTDAVTADAAGMFAQASRLIKPYNPTRAEDLLKKALLAWSFLAKKNALKPESSLLYAALQLYLATATGDKAADMGNEYHARFIALAKEIIVKDGPWPMQYLAGNTSAKIQTVHFISYLITSQPVDGAIKESLSAKIISQAESGGYMGKVESTAYPQGATKFYDWGAATAQGRYADVAAFASLLSINPVKKQYFYDIVSQYGDYSVGLNPLGQSFVTGLGVAQPQSPLHLDSWYTKYGKGDHTGNPIGNVPGIVVYGPNEGRSGAEYQTILSNKMFPEWDNRPAQRRWADGWSLVNSNEFSTWETMVWNTCMYGFLSNADRSSSIEKATSPSPHSKYFHIQRVANGSIRKFQIIAPDIQGRFAIMDLKGRVVYRSALLDNAGVFTLPEKGVYLVQLTTLDHGNLAGKVIVQ